MKVYLAGADFVLHSWHYIPREEASLFGTFFTAEYANKLLEKTSAKIRPGLITIDSGTFTFLHSSGISCVSGKSKTNLPQIDAYVQNYFDWVEKVYDRIDYFVELDVQEIVGLDKVKKWREEWKRRGLYDKCITCYHSVDTWRDFEEMIDTSQSRYVALEGAKGRSFRLPLKKCIKYCYERDVKVHGFAMTNSTILEDCPFYSVDSSTWSMGVRYGAVQMFKNGKLRSFSRYGELQKKFIAPPSLCGSVRGTIFNRQIFDPIVEQFIAMEKHFTKLWEARGIHWKD